MENASLVAEAVTYGIWLRGDALLHAALPALAGCSGLLPPFEHDATRVANYRPRLAGDSTTTSSHARHCTATLGSTIRINTQPRAIGRSGAAIHSLHEPGYRRDPGRPAMDIANTL